MQLFKIRPLVDVYVLLWITGQDTISPSLGFKYPAKIHNRNKDVFKGDEPSELIEEKIRRASSPEQRVWSTDFGRVARSGKWTDRFHRFGYPFTPDKSVNLGPRPKEGSLWPQPQESVLQRGTYQISVNLQFESSVTEECDIMEFNIRRAYYVIFGTDYANIKYRTNMTESNRTTLDDVIKTVLVFVEYDCTPHSYPSLESDESYSLRVSGNTSTIIIRAAEIWGAIRGLQTFSQMVYYNKTVEKYVIENISMKDFPSFPHRGILLDSARHFLSVDTIIDNLEAMAENKMNVFHWHLTDDQSFPYQSQRFPNLSAKGAYDPVSKVYTHDNVRLIVEAARLRGIRVIPEFDVPGHTSAWGYGHPEILTQCYKKTGKRSDIIGPLNVLSNTTWSLLKDFFKEISKMFPDGGIHFGGDEVDPWCWLSNPNIQKYFEGNSSVTHIFKFFNDRLTNIRLNLSTSNSTGRQITQYVWEESFSNVRGQLREDIIIQLWKSSLSYAESLMAKGFRVVYSTCWYLDHHEYGVHWPDIYNCESLVSYRFMTNPKYFLGGEACLWSEYVDSNNILQLLWPRALAVAERLWTNPKSHDLNEVGSRLEQQRCRMLRRGISVGVTSGPGSCSFHSSRSKLHFSNKKSLLRTIKDHLKIAADITTEGRLFTFFIITAIVITSAANFFTAIRPSLKNYIKLLKKRSHCFKLIYLALVIFIICYALSLLN